MTQQFGQPRGKTLRFEKEDGKTKYCIGVYLSEANMTVRIKQKSSPK